MNKDLTEVVFILDRSGSMHGLEKDVVGGFNSTIDEQKKKDGQCIVSTVLFNNHSKVVHDRISIEEIDEMKEGEYLPSGSTALIDALGDSIKFIKKVHKVIRKEDVPAHTIFIITTDGQENSSHKYSSKDVKKMISERQEKGWEFIYLAANIDAVETSKMYGFKQSRVRNYISDKRGNECAFGAINNFVSVVRETSVDEDMDKVVECSKIFVDLDKDYNSRKNKNV